MRGLWKKLWVVPVVAIATLAGCDDGRTPMEVLPPAQAVLASSTTQTKYTLVEESLLRSASEALSVSSVIGASGGKVELLGHSLAVPPGAVTEPTLFTLTVRPSGYVEVDLSATVSSALGVVDVGSKGFRKPVTVSLTFSRATNVVDASKLLVVWKKTGYDDLQAVPSKVSIDKQTVTATLEHFSEYMLAYP